MAPFLGPKLKEAKGGLSQEWRRREPLRESEQQIERFRQQVKVIACQRPILLFLTKHFRNQNGSLVGIAGMACSSD